MNQQRDLVCQLIISPEEATAGCWKTVVYQRPLPGGSAETCQVQLEVPAGTSNGTQARFKGRGLPGLGSLPPGDLYLRITLHPDETKPSPPENSTLFETSPVPALSHEPVLPPITGDEALPASAPEVSTFLEQPELGASEEFELEKLPTPTPTASTFPYEVKELIGQGGMGLVHRVYHRQWQMDLAVKTPSDKALRQAGGRERFQQREAREWVRLGLHPNIASCFYVHTLEDGLPRIFIEYVNGGSLASWLKEGRISGVEIGLDLGIQICWGLAWAHQRGLVHRDIKPANILMTAEGIPKVTDFGLVKPVGATEEAQPISPPAGASTEATLLAGTPGYAPPEQWRGGGSITPAADVYAVGIILYEMLASLVGLAWPGQAVAQLWHKLLLQGLQQARPAHSPLAETEWAALVRLLKRCLADQPQDRYPDAAALAEELQLIYESLIQQPYPRPTPDYIRSLADGLNNQAVSLLDLGHGAEALDLLEQALQADRNHLEALYNRGLLLWRAGQMSDLELVQLLEERSASSPNEWLPAYLLAQVHLERGDLVTALKVLRDIEPLAAGQEEVKAALVQSASPQSRRLLKTLPGHSGPVISVCLSPAGDYALSGSQDKTLKLWRLPAGRVGKQRLLQPCLRTFSGHTHTVSSACLNLEKRIVLSGSLDWTLKLWDLTSGECRQTLEGHLGGVTTVHLSENGRYALSGSADNTLKLWDLADLSPGAYDLHTFRGHLAPVIFGYLSHNQSWTLSGSQDGTLKLWEVVSGSCLYTFNGHKQGLQVVALSRDESLAVSGGGEGSINVWDIANRQLLRTFKGHAGGVQALCVSPEGDYILSTGLDQALKLWEVGSGRCLYTFTSGTEALQTLCWSDDGAYALSGEAGPGYALKLWSVAGETYQAPGKLCRTLGSSEIYSVQQGYRQALEQARQALSQGEAAVAALHLREARAQPGFRRAEEALQLWRQLHLKLGRQRFLGGWVEAVVAEGQAEITSLALSPPGDYALSGSADALLKLWRITPAAGGRPGSVVCLRTFTGHKAAVTTLCLSASGRLALSGSAEWRGLKLWEVASGRCLHTLDGHGEAVTAVCLSQDERYILSGGVDQKLKLWDVARGYCLRTLGGHTGPISAICFSAAGQYALSASLDRSLKLWDMVTGRCWRTFTGHEAPVTALVLSQDERYFLSGSQDGSLKLWSLASGRCLRTFTGHTGAINSVCLSADRQYALSGSADKTFKLWKVATGKSLRTFKGHREAVTAVTLSQDGQYILSGSRDQSLQLWALDWELAPNQPGDWDERARPYLALFLAGQTPYLETLPEGREPFPEDMALALIRQGAPVWDEADLERLGQMLSRAGYGWLRPEGVRRKLAELSQDWPASPAIPGVEPDLYRQLCQATIHQAIAARQSREKAWAALRETWRWQKPLGRALSLGWRIPVAISTIAAGLSEGNRASLKGVLPVFTFIFSIPLVILLIPALFPALLFMLLQDLFAFRNNYRLSQKLLEEGVMVEARVRRKQMERGILYNSPEYSVEYNYQAPEPATRLLTTFTNREPVSPEFYAWLKPEMVLQVRYLADKPQTARLFFHGYLSRRT